MPDGSVSLCFGKEGATMGFGAGYYYVTLTGHYAKNVSWDCEPLKGRSAWLKHHFSDLQGKASAP